MKVDCGVIIRLALYRHNLHYRTYKPVLGISLPVYLAHNSGGNMVEIFIGFPFPLWTIVLLIQYMYEC